MTGGSCHAQRCPPQLRGLGVRETPCPRQLYPCPAGVAGAFPWDSARPMRTLPPRSPDAGLQTVLLDSTAQGPNPGGSVLHHRRVRHPRETRPPPLTSSGHLHMLSCRTKLAMLLCLKYLGSTSLANWPWSSTWKLFPLCQDMCRQSHAVREGDRRPYPSGGTTLPPCGAEPWGPGKAEFASLTSSHVCLVSAPQPVSLSEVWDWATGATWPGREEGPGAPAPGSWSFPGTKFTLMRHHSTWARSLGTHFSFHQQIYPENS